MLRTKFVVGLVIGEGVKAVAREMLLERFRNAKL